MPLPLDTKGNPKVQKLISLTNEKIKAIKAEKAKILSIKNYASKEIPIINSKISALTSNMNSHDEK